MVTWSWSDFTAIVSWQTINLLTCVTSILIKPQLWAQENWYLIQKYIIMSTFDSSTIRQSDMPKLERLWANISENIQLTVLNVDISQKINIKCPKLFNWQWCDWSSLYALFDNCVNLFNILYDYFQDASDAEYEFLQHNLIIEITDVFP